VASLPVAELAAAVPRVPPVLDALPLEHERPVRALQRALAVRRELAVPQARQASRPEPLSAPPSLSVLARRR
jgi:hypothetical protein